jgi:uncharacterized phiE125 gp8 family phage protein
MAEPVTLAEAKAQCRMVEDNSEDTFLTSLLAPSRAYVERYTGYFYDSGNRTATFTRWGDFLEIPRRPVTSITSVTYTNEDGNNATYTGFLTTIGNYSTRIYPAIDDDFPALADGGLITVVYVAGALGSTSEEYLIGKRAMLLLIGHWFENREAAALGVTSTEVDFAVRSLLDELRPLSAY